MGELIARLELLLGQTDAEHSEIRDLIEQLEDRETVQNAMQSFIESQYRDEFEATLSFDEQEVYRTVFELDSGADPYGDDYFDEDNDE